LSSKNLKRLKMQCWKGLQHYEENCNCEKVMKSEIFFDTLSQLQLAQDTAFLLWQYQKIEGREKPAKIPISTTKNRINPTNQENLITLDAAKMAYLGGIGDGIGYSLGFNDVICIDVDSCIIGEGFNYSPMAAYIAELFWGTYCETSPSLNGLHFFLRGKLPDRRNRLKIEIAGVIYEVEIYAEKRYIALTGLLENSSTEIKLMQNELNRLYSIAIAPNNNVKELIPSPSCVLNPEPGNYPDCDLISQIQQSKNADKFNALWRGNWQNCYKSQSEADLALCSMIAFYNQNENFVDEKFRQSGLMREKWNYNKTYRNNTLSLAIQKLKGKYMDNLDQFINENFIGKRKNNGNDNSIVELSLIGIVENSEKAIRAHVKGSQIGMNAEVVAFWIPRKLAAVSSKPKTLGVPAWFVARKSEGEGVVVVVVN
jgi:primase-polymerase (primpol)-like protein